MKILIVSDSHGSTRYLYDAIEREKPFDMLMHLGDVCGDEDEIEMLAGAPQIPCAMVAGNCDMFTRLPDKRDMVLHGVHIHMEHGNWPPVRDELLTKRAPGAQIMMFGHTHKPEIREVNGIRVINPGSISRPRQADGLHTYIVMDLNSDGSYAFTLKAIEKE